MVFLGCESQNSEVSVTNENNLPRVYSTAKWPVYSSLKELIANSDLVVVGEAVQQEPGRLVPDMSSTVGMPTTNTDVFVKTVLKGSTKVQSTVVVEQTGGAYVQTNEEEKQTFEETVWLEIDEDPLFSVGEKDLLFLKWIPELKVYQFIPQGRYQIKSDKLVSLHPEDVVSKYLNGKTLTGAVIEIKVLVNSK